MMKFRNLPPLAIVSLALLAGACSSNGTIAVSKVFRQPPWTGPESMTYQVADRGIAGTGSCTLTTTPEVEPGKTRLDRVCTKDEFRDAGSVLADSKTLAPFSSTRTYTDSKKNQTTTHTIGYEGTVARFRTDDGSKVRDTTRNLPSPDATSPDPGWYDDDSLLWLARGLDLRAGYVAGYVHVINAGQPRVLSVQVRVEGSEQVKVPAGEFTTWKVRYQREDSIYYVWVDVASPNRMVQARIEDVIYQLTSVK